MWLLFIIKLFYGTFKLQIIHYFTNQRRAQRRNTVRLLTYRSYLLLSTSYLTFGKDIDSLIMDPL